jgi:glycosyltransferase involved in cell wall biosynthesis
MESDFYPLHPAVTRITLNMARESKTTRAALVNNLRRIHALRRTLGTVKPDIALGMMSSANIILALAAARLPGLATLGAERTYPPRLALDRPWEFLRAHVYHQLDSVVAQTDESATWLRRHTHARRVDVIPNAAHRLSPFDVPRLTARPAGKRPHTLLAVGRLEAVKGFDLLLTVFSRLAGRFSDWQLVIVGDGSQREALQLQLAALGLEGRVTLPGRSANVTQWYQISDLYVMTSRYEGFPNALCEAMAYGLPAVSFDCDTGPRDIIRHDVDGLLVPVEDVAALESALSRMMGDAELRETYSARASEVSERFSQERIYGLWETLFKELQEDARAR